MRKKKQFVRPTVRLLEDVDALSLLTASKGSDEEIVTDPMFNLGTGDNGALNDSGAKAFHGGY